uniref:Putative secreted protein n=1 Tax=Anopheles marajoara TaxID=58244 RepID=A0A2M4C1J0_9DIPT
MKLQILALVVCVAFVVGNEVDSGAPESTTDLVQPDQAEVDNAEPAVEDPQPLEEAPEDAPDAEQEELPDQPDQEPDQEPHQPEEEDDSEDSEESDESDEADDDKEVIELLEKLHDRQEELDYLNRYLLGRLGPIHASLLDARPTLVRLPFRIAPWNRRRPRRYLPRLG